MFNQLFMCYRTYSQFKLKFILFTMRFTWNIFCKSLITICCLNQKWSWCHVQGRFARCKCYWFMNSNIKLQIMMRFDLNWCSFIWYGMMWHDMISIDSIWYDMVLFDMVSHVLIWYGMVRYVYIYIYMYMYIYMICTL